jgi:hypothetical protein
MTWCVDCGVILRIGWVCASCKVYRANAPAWEIEYCRRMLARWGIELVGDAAF